MKMKRARQTAIAALIAAGALSACTTVTPGTPETADLSKGYTGPELSTEALTSTPLFLPGADISIGLGKNRVTCTAGWLVKFKGSFGILTAGQCGRSGTGSPTSFLWDDHGTDKPITLGTLAETTFKEPYNHSTPDVAVISIEDTKDNHNVPFDSITDPRHKPVNAVIGDPKVGDAKELATKDKGGEVCWYSGVTGDKRPSDIKHCGTIVAGDFDKVMVKPNSPDDYSPAMAGAPAVWNAPDGKVFPVGVVTDFYKDHVVIDTIGKMLNKAGAELLLH